MPRLLAVEPILDVAQMADQMWEITLLPSPPGNIGNRYNDTDISELKNLSSIAGSDVLAGNASFCNSTSSSTPNAPAYDATARCRKWRRAQSGKENQKIER